ncbi:unnamed protein product [Fusarium langsethiae]|nr:unnamed protein product [Fusarium langsethiae]
MALVRPDGGVSHSFTMDRVMSETLVRGHITLVKGGLEVILDVIRNRIDINITNEEVQKRRSEWKPPGTTG